MPASETPRTRTGDAPESRPPPEERADWRREIGDDLRRPSFEVTYLEALSRRLRRVLDAATRLSGVTLALVHDGTYNPPTS